MKLSYLVLLSTLSAATASKTASPILTTLAKPASIKAKSVKGLAIPVPAISTTDKAVKGVSIKGKPTSPITLLPASPITTSTLATSVVAPTNPLLSTPASSVTPMTSLIGTKTTTTATTPVSSLLTSTNPLLSSSSSTTIVNPLVASTNTTNGGAGGDPHFRTYDGTMYSYHGQCDLVMARSSTFGNGLGIDVHARTEIVTGWSLISNAAIRIGNDIFEIVNNDIYYINGQSNIELPFMMANKYQVSYTEEYLEHKIQSGELIKSKRSFYKIQLNTKESILLTVFRKMISVRVNAKLSDTVGMLGIHGHEGMIGRDMITNIDDPNVMGAEWQVTNIEPMLFHEVRAPQYPEVCQLPVVQSRRRLRVSDTLMKQAELACANVDKNMYDFCLQDVLLTGDSELADGYGDAW